MGTSILPESLDAFFSFAFRRMQKKTGLVRFYCSVVNLQVRGRSYSKGERAKSDSTGKFTITA